MTRSWFGGVSPRYLPGGRTVAAHDNALNCLQSDQQMTASGSSSRCSRRNRSSIPRGRRKHLSDPRRGRGSWASDIQEIGLHRLSKCLPMASVISTRRCHTPQTHPTLPHLLLLLLPQPGYKRTNLVRCWFFQNTVVAPHSSTRRKAQSSV